MNPKKFNLKCFGNYNDINVQNPNYNSFKQIFGVEQNNDLTIKQKNIVKYLTIFSNSLQNIKRIIENKTIKNEFGNYVVITNLNITTNIIVLKSDDLWDF